MKAIKLLIILISINAYCQNAVIDSSAVEFKAKLFTVSEFGIANKEVIMDDIENQKIKFLNTFYKNNYFLKIEFSQPYRLPNKHITTLRRNCVYYIAYNHITAKFYRLGGFDVIDIDDFMNDLIKNEPYITDIINRNEIEEIDFDCLYSYYKLSKKQRFKKGYTCFDNCKQNTKTSYIEH